jgi:hypothetical protein
MKGIIFNVLEDMIVQQCGMQVWNELLQQHAPKNRVYISAKSYEAAELFSIAQDVASRLNVPLQQVVKAFGQFLFHGLASRHQDVVAQFTDFTSLVLGIHHVIHTEVNKLYHDPSLPTISGRLITANQIELHYSSPRQLCFCAEGLLFGAAEHFKKHISISHPVCMHHGAPHCVLLVDIQDES